MSWYYREDYTRERYSSLIAQLSCKRETFCGIGTRKAKLRLNKLAKTDPIAKLYRKAIEIEDKNIQAKAYPDYRDRNYDEKSHLIDEFVELCKENNVKVGYQIQDDEYRPLCVVYVELPDCEQISWHTYDVPSCDQYDKEWDGKQESTLPKLEAAIRNKFPEILA